MAINLSVTCGLEAGRTFLRHSLLTLILLYSETRGICHVFTYQHVSWAMGDFLGEQLLKFWVLQYSIL